MDLLPGLPNDVGLECLVRIPHQCFSSISSVCKYWKRQIELPEFWLRRKASGSTRRVLVLIQSRVGSTRDLDAKQQGGGFGPVYRLTICEPETGYWAGLPPIPCCANGLPTFCQMVGVGSDLVVMGGCDPVTWEVSSAVYVYSFVSATWRRGADMPGCRRLFFAACAGSDFGSGRVVLVAGGHDGEKCALRSAMVYDVAGDDWVLLPDMLLERDEAKAVFHSGRFHVIGGYETNMQGRFGTSAEWFDFDTWQWGTVVEDFLDSATCPRNVVVVNDEGELFMCRGMEVVCRQEFTWRVVAEVPMGVRNIAYMTAWRGTIVVIGSEKCGGAYVAYVLDLKRRRWEEVGAAQEFSGHVQLGCCLEL